MGPGLGNGKAAAILYAREGAQVLCVDLNQSAADETVSQIVEEGGNACAFVGDMSKEPNAAAFRSAMEDYCGGIDVLHFNIGISSKGGIAETELDDWNRVFAINLTSAMLTARAVLPLMKEQRSGALVFISTLAAVMAGPYAYASYEASKAALCRMSASIAAEYAPHGIRSNTVLPGLIDTPHVTQYIGPETDPEALAAARAKMVPMGRQGTAWDVARAAMFLVSDDAAFITGVDLRVDGGMSL